MIELSLSAAFIIGLLSSTHCVGMCGGISMGLSAQSTSKSPQSKLAILTLFNFGRIGTYTLLGVIAGIMGETLVKQWAFLADILRVIAGVLLILMGLYISQWWNGIIVLEKAGKLLWKRIQPLSSRYLNIQRTQDALTLGLLWGFLPCGLIYSMLSWALASGQISTAPLLMLAFGCGTLPSMFLTGLFGQQLFSQLRQRKLRQGASILVMLLGMVTIFSPFIFSHHQHAYVSPASMEKPKETALIATTFLFNPLTSNHSRQ